jgi:predicted nucleic-acid-binding protein
MLAVDTNIIVRYLTADDAAQFARAAALMRSSASTGGSQPWRTGSAA